MSIKPEEARFLGAMLGVTVLTLIMIVLGLDAGAGALGQVRLLTVF